MEITRTPSLDRVNNVLVNSKRNHPLGNPQATVQTLSNPGLLGKFFVKFQESGFPDILKSNACPGKRFGQMLGGYGVEGAW